MKKNIRAAALLLALLLLLTGCGPKYRTDVKPSAITDTVLAGLPDTDGLVSLDASILGALGLDTSKYADFSVVGAPLSSTMNEFGVFKAKDEKQVAEIEKALGEYLDTLRNIYKMYPTAETAKLDSAKTQTCGLYVMYAILSPGDQAAAFSYLEKAVKK